MPEITTIMLVIAVVGIALFVLSFFFKVLKLVFKIFFVANLVLFLVGGILGYLVYQDFIDLKTNFPTDDKIILLEHNEEYLAGMEISEISLETEGNESDDLPLTPIGQNTLEEYNNAELENILDDNYKVIVIKSDFFTNVPEIEFEDGLKFETQELIDVIAANNSPNEFAKLISDSTAKLSEQLGIDQTDERFDDTLLIFMTISVLQNEGPQHIIKELNTGNLIIYPETITFKMINYIPENMFGENILNKLD
jgi:hypothetical protein